MFRNKIKRLLVSASKDLLRNIWLNVATVIILVISLFTVTVMLAVDAIGDHALGALKEKIDITVQFKDNADEGKILELQKDLQGRSDVKNVEYISKDQALTNFKEAHKDDSYINDSLTELGDNPLFAVLNVKANELDQYKDIDNFVVGNENYKDIIEKVNFKENETAINNFSNILAAIKEGILALSVLFVLIGVMVAFNTIRLAMYAHKTEIEIMRLVGAGNWYIRMPFIIEGIVFGVVSCAVAIALMFPAVSYVSPKIAQFIPGFDLNNYFIGNLYNITLLLLSMGVGIGVISSVIAIRRYLKI
ncbi:MAG: permease-like cell division protein FtsX [Candidatus Paceibacterota bacterium]|jgi:cell division transport system permease protein